MKITKYEHACLVVEDGNRLLVIDPGSFTTSLPKDLKNVEAIVITHVHGDHLNQKNIANIVRNNPNLIVFGTQEVADQLSSLKVQVVSGGSKAKAGPFKLAFFGGEHAIIHESWPKNQNVGLLVNDRLYYPGDSFTVPQVKVSVLALPVSAPWLKLAESMDFLTAVRPKIAFPTHNALLSEIGENLNENILGGVAKALNCKFQTLNPGSSIDI